MEEVLNKLRQILQWIEIICENCDAYIVVKDLLATATNENDKTEKHFAFKSNAPCIERRYTRS